MRSLVFLGLLVALLLIPVAEVTMHVARQPAVSLTFSADSDGRQETWLSGRRVLWQQPALPPPPGGYPAVILLHGASQRADTWFHGRDRWSTAQTSFTHMALEQGILVVAPESRRPLFWGPRGWDAFAATLNTSDDLPFIRDIIRWLDTLPVNTSRLSCTGFSSGAFMTSRIARVFPDRFAAVAIHSGADATAIHLAWRGPELDCTMPLGFPPGYPPTMVVHGRHDRVVPATCGIHLYAELRRHDIPSALLLTDDGHIWQAAYNAEILSWLTA